MLALQDDWISDGDYSVLILRRTFADLNQPEGILTRAHQWLDGKRGVRWEAKHDRFVFDSGAMIQFGYCNRPRDHLKYRGGKYNIVCWDELTDFSEEHYTFLFSRQRRPKGSTLPLLTASASNPGGPGHTWVRRRLVRNEENKPDRVFIAASYEDNPHLDQEAYSETLDNLLPVERERIKRGNWDVRDSKTLFQREWFPIIAKMPNVPALWVRAWDTGATEGGGDPSVGLKMAMHRGTCYITAMAKGQYGPEAVDEVQFQTAKADGTGVTIVVEQEPGSGSKRINAQLAKKLRGYYVVSVPSGHDKYTRAIPAARAAHQGRVVLVEGPWNGEFLDTVCNFTGRDGDGHDDEVDAFSLGFNHLDGKVRAAIA